MTELMRQEGLPYGHRSMTYNSRLAQELATWADTQPGVEGIHLALFQAYFVDNINLAMTDHLVAIATTTGLDPQGSREVLQTRGMRAAVDED